jgi:hypothetical protein
MRALVLCVIQVATCAGAQEIGAQPLPPLVRRALEFLPGVRPDQVILLEDLKEVAPFLRARGYSAQAVTETTNKLQGLAEFTIDHRFPIFINGATWHYQRILASWKRGKSPDEAARVLASDLYHEYRHAACGEEEHDALRAHISLLKIWREQGLLTIADPYIRAKEAELKQVPNGEGGINSNQAPSTCSPSSSGSDLPLLLRDAIRTLNDELARQSATLVPSDVVFVRNAAILKERMPTATLPQLQMIADQFRMLVVENRPPIYVLAARPDMETAIDLYKDGKAPHLRYIFAAMLGHEWFHAFRGERFEARAYAFELDLLLGFWENGRLPIQSAPDIDRTAERLMEAWKIELAKRKRQ